MYCVVLPEAAVYKYFGMYVNSCKEISIRHAEVFRAESWGTISSRTSLPDSLKDTALSVTILFSQSP